MKFPLIHRQEYSDCHEQRRRHYTGTGTGCRVQHEIERRSTVSSTRSRRGWCRNAPAPRASRWRGRGRCLLIRASAPCPRDRSAQTSAASVRWECRSRSREHRIARHLPTRRPRPKSLPALGAILQCVVNQVGKHLGEWHRGPPRPGTKQCSSTVRVQPHELAASS